MKIKLTRPNYKINFKLLEKDLFFIQNEKLWRMIRKRIVFFMDGYRYAAISAYKRWGIPFIFFEVGHESRKSVYFSGTLDKKAAELWHQKIGEESSFSTNLIKDFLNIINTQNKLAKSISKRTLNKQKIKKYLLAHLDYWIKFFELAHLWFCIDGVKDRINEEIKKNWLGSKNELSSFLNQIYRPIKWPVSSMEQRDLLRLKFFKGEELNKEIKKHWQKYKHLGFHNDINDDFFSIDYFLDRLNVLKQTGEYQKAKKIFDNADEELKRADFLLKKAKLSKALKRKVIFIRWFMYLRTETIDYMSLVSSAYKPVFELLALVFDLPLPACLNLTYDEIIYSLDNGLSLNLKNLALERLNNGYAYLIAPHGSYLVIGDEIDKLHNLVVPFQKRMKEIKVIKGVAAFTGRVRGIARVILDSQDAHELRSQEVLVTAMTNPKFVPAMKKSAAIITNEGGILCHAAIMSREFRKPCIIGTKVATDIIKTGDLVEVDANKGVVKIIK